MKICDNEQNIGGAALVPRIREEDEGREEEHREERQLSCEC